MLSLSSCEHQVLVPEALRPTLPPDRRSRVPTAIRQVVTLLYVRKADFLLQVIHIDELIHSVSEPTEPHSGALFAKGETDESQRGLQSEVRDCFSSCQGVRDL